MASFPVVGFDQASHLVQQAHRRAVGAGLKSPCPRSPADESTDSAACSTRQDRAESCEPRYARSSRHSDQIVSELPPRMPALHVLIPHQRRLSRGFSRRFWHGERGPVSCVVVGAAYVELDERQSNRTARRAPLFQPSTSRPNAAGQVAATHLTTRRERQSWRRLPLQRKLNRSLMARDESAATAKRSV